jgi:hypothetical protein
VGGQALAQEEGSDANGDGDSNDVSDVAADLDSAITDTGYDWGADMYGPDSPNAFSDAFSDVMADAMAQQANGVSFASNTSAQFAADMLSSLGFSTYDALTAVASVMGSPALTGPGPTTSIDNRSQEITYGIALLGLDVFLSLEELLGGHAPFDVSPPGGDSDSGGDES